MTTKHYKPTKKEINAVLDVSILARFLHDWLQTQHINEEEENELTQLQQIKQRQAVENAYKGALLIKKAVKDFQFC